MLPALVKVETTRAAGDTRFATNQIMLERLVSVKSSLEQMVVSSRWTDWADSRNCTYASAMKEKKSLVLNERWWEKAQELVAVMTPIKSKLLRLADSDKPCTGEVYAQMQMVKQELQELDIAQVRLKPILRLVDSRFEMALESPIYYAGYALNPKYVDADESTSAAIMDGLFTMIDRVLPDEADQATAHVQYNYYKEKKGLFGKAVIFSDRILDKTMPWEWWNMYGGSVPELQKVAMRVLAQVASAGAAERNWSDFDFIHNKKRNRLGADKAKKLVKVFSNLRMLKNMDKKTAAVN